MTRTSKAFGTLAAVTTINAYDRSGHFEGRLLNTTGQPLTISGLWGLRFPAGSLNAVPGALYFTAGINDEHDGLFGDLVPKR